jgi:hypothetical protein
MSEALENVPLVADNIAIQLQGMIDNPDRYTTEDQRMVLRECVRMVRGIEKTVIKDVWPTARPTMFKRWKDR